MTANINKQEKAELQQHWQEAWPKALSVWSRYTRLRDPLFCINSVDAAKQGLTQSFAMIRLRDQSIVIDFEAVDRYQLHDYAVEILAHEIGHHVFVPASISDHARMIAAMRINLPTLENQVAMMANLFSDLLINHHLFQQCDLSMDQIYLRMNAQPVNSRVWCLYMRIFELLWQSEPGSLGGHCGSDSMEGDAWLGARIIKVYANDWLTGAARFAALMLPYLLEEKNAVEQIQSLMDTQGAGEGLFPGGLIQMDGVDNLHPAQDPELVGDQNTASSANEVEPVEAPDDSRSGGQCREPFEYGEILRAAGVSLSDHEVAVRYYRERAQPHIVPFPSRLSPSVFDPVPEGTTLWEMGEPPENIDWFASKALSSVVIPGMTTLQRVWGEEPGHQQEVRPCNLDIYVDCSGSMPNPQVNISYTALAGAILCRSALRAGAAVQVTLWSGKHQLRITDGFVRNEQAVLNVLTDYLGGWTAFPIHVLRETYLEKTLQQDTHIVILSDDGVTTLFDEDEKNNSGWDVAEAALEKAQGGGTMLLNLPWAFPESATGWHEKDHEKLLMAQAAGWDIHRVDSWEAMLAFAKTFSHKNYHNDIHQRHPIEK